MLLMHLQNSLAGIARACQSIERSGANGCFVVCDIFNMPHTQLQLIATSDAALEQYFTATAIRDPLTILQRAMSKSDRLALVVPMPEVMLKRITALRRLFPAQILISVVCDPVQQPRLSLQLLQALTRCGGKPRRALVMFVGGGVRELAHMAFAARHGLRLLLLEGSGRLAQLLRKLWPNRASSSFDAVAMQTCLSQTFAGMADVDSVEDLRVILSCGELVVHSIVSNSAVLERLCVQQLTGDRVLLVARNARDKYLSTSRNYAWPQRMLSMLSIVMAFAATVAAIMASERGLIRTNGLFEKMGLTRRLPLPDEADFHSFAVYLCAALPVVLVVVDSIEGLMSTSEAQAAVQRAAGLVTQALYLYRCRAGDYADGSLSKSDDLLASGSGSGTDLSTLRQVMLSHDLATISAVVDESGALLAQRSLPSTQPISEDPVSSSTSGGAWWHGEHAYGSAIETDAARCVGEQMLAVPDFIDGDDYVRERVVPQLERSLSIARYTLLTVVAARIMSVAAAALGVALAMQSSTEWVTITVAASTAAARMLQTTRAEARRRAHTRAVLILNAARVRWESLPAEVRALQGEVDRLVLKVEQAIEATLPPATSDVAARKASWKATAASTSSNLNA